MRRRLLGSTLAVAIVAVVLLGLPLGWLSARFVHEEAQRRLQEEAQRIAIEVEDRVEHSEGLNATRLRGLVGAGQHLTVTRGGGVSFEAGPWVPEPRLVVTAPVDNDGRITLTASTAADRARVARDWLYVAGLVALSTAVAIALAVLQARRLGRPLEELAGTAQRLGSGDTRPVGRRYGVPEIDRVAAVLDHSAERLGALLTRERQFASDASHQLRTPLAALSIRLEEIALASDSAEVRSEAEAGLAQVERLGGVVESLLATARDSRAGSAVAFDVAAVLREQVREWEPAYRRVGRAIVVDTRPGLTVAATPGTVGQVVASLLDNALLHGAGTVTLRARPAVNHVVVEVSDEGEGVPAELVGRVFERSVSGGSGTGLGLTLARALVESDGGRLELVHARPPVFAAFLPVAKFG